MYPLRARLQELKDTKPHSRRKENTPEAGLTHLKNWGTSLRCRQTEANLVGAGYRTLDSIPRIQIASGDRGTILLPPFKRVRQTDPRNSNELDPKTTQIPGPSTFIGHKRTPSAKLPRSRATERNENNATIGQI